LATATLKSTKWMLTVCMFVCLYGYRGTDFSAEDKASDVTIIKIHIQIAIFRKIIRNRYRIFWSKCDIIPIPYCSRGTSDLRSQNGFYTPASQSRRVWSSLHTCVSHRLFCSFLAW